MSEPPQQALFNAKEMQHIITYSDQNYRPFWPIENEHKSLCVVAADSPQTTETETPN